MQDDNTLYTPIPEEVVEQAATICDEEDNSFRRVWNAGQGFKSAGMTPLYLLNNEEMMLFVVAAETFGKKLN